MGDFGSHSQCEVCNAPLYSDDKYRTDNDGFTGCLPCFPRTTDPADKRAMVGPCYRARKELRA